MIALIRDMGATDPGLLFFVGIVFGAVIALTILALGAAWDRANARLDALIADAVPPRTRPTSSNRKAGRSS